LLISDEPVYKEQAVKMTMLQLLGYLNITLDVGDTFPDYQDWHRQLQEKVF